MTRQSIREVFKAHGYHHIDTGILDPLIDDILKTNKGTKMKKITQLEFGAMTHRQTWDHINSLQSELEALEGWKGQGGMTMELKDFLLGNQPLEGVWFGEKHPTKKGAFWWREYLYRVEVVPQGFTPDWSKAPEWAVQYRGYWVKNELPEVRLLPGEVLESRPLPPKVTRERTDKELIRDLLKKSVISSSVMNSIRRETILDLCTAAGISTTTEEV